MGWIEHKTTTNEKPKMNMEFQISKNPENVLQVSQKWNKIFPSSTHKPDNTYTHNKIILMYFTKIL